MKPVWSIAVGLACVMPLAAAESPYAGQERRQIKSLSSNEIESLENGAGMGFAKAAELNHFPGPRHVIDLAEELELTSSQLSASKSLFAEMNESARTLGRELLAAEAALDRAFAQESIDARTLESALLEIGEIRARLRYVHLEAHLRQRRLLNEIQVSRYDELRGYDDPATNHAEHFRHHD